MSVIKHCFCGMIHHPKVFGTINNSGLKYACAVKKKIKNILCWPVTDFRIVFSNCVKNSLKLINYYA